MLLVALFVEVRPPWIYVDPFCRREDVLGYITPLAATSSDVWLNNPIDIDTGCDFGGELCRTCLPRNGVTRLTGVSTMMCAWTGLRLNSHGKCQSNSLDDAKLCR